ncbi:MAG TPA: tRNA pseudouridine(38-40) synthase TruA [Deltaproteobacteria bacterium]|nr:tRNA pseudouridine(38-40) synthase TruA [Deltaproteobacteria bacterium]
MKFKLILAYDGSGYHGWQVQAGDNSVQETLERALGKILSHDVRVTASGRTDTGVHALGQVVSFGTSSSIPAEGLMKALNSLLPPDIRVLQASTAEPDFHARYGAVSKTYLYVIDTEPVMSPFSYRYALHHPGSLDLEAMDRAAGLLLGEHDFRSFMGTGSEVKTTVRRIIVSTVFAKGSKVFFVIQGSGFLRHMVRNIVGTLIQIGEGRIAPGEMTRILELKDRVHAGPTAPPQGLYLVSVEYGGGSNDSPEDERGRH